MAGIGFSTKILCPFIPDVLAAALVGWLVCQEARATGGR